MLPNNYIAKHVPEFGDAGIVRIGGLGPQEHSYRLAGWHGLFQTKCAMTAQ